MGPVSDLTCCMRPPVCPQFWGLTTAPGSHNLQPGLCASLGGRITAETLQTAAWFRAVALRQAKPDIMRSRCRYSKEVEQCVI